MWWGEGVSYDSGMEHGKGKLINVVADDTNKILEHVKKTKDYRKILENFPDAQLINIEEQD